MSAEPTPSACVCGFYSKEARHLCLQPSDFTTDDVAATRKWLAGVVRGDVIPSKEQMEAARLLLESNR